MRTFQESKMSQISRKKFSIGWIVTSYFMIFGGIYLMAVLLGALNIQGAWTRYAMFSLGSLIGGFFTGRASPHKSIVEPALGAIAMVVTLALFFFVTPIGQFLFDFGKSAIIRDTIIIGALSLAGGIGGAFLGEYTTKNNERAGGPFSWLAYSTLISMGAILASFFLLTIMLVRGDVTSFAQLKYSALGALGLSSVAGAVVTQIAAPRRMVLISSGGFLAAIMAMSLISGVRSAPSGLFIGLIIIGLGGSFLGLGAARMAWQFVRHFK
jgi:hypothetical protein